LRCYLYVVKVASVASKAFVDEVDRLLTPPCG